MHPARKTAPRGLGFWRVRLQSQAFLIAVFEFVLLIFSLSFHECAHAWMASRLGDQTARLQGRVTLNPMYHVDPVGTLLFPALMIFGPLIGGGMLGGYLIGWAKPTPVITRNFKNIVRDDNLTTLAGPVSNLILALCGFLGLVAIILFMRNVPVATGDAEQQSLSALATLCQLGDPGQPLAVLLQSAADSAARRQPYPAQLSALQRWQLFRPDRNSRSATF